MSYAAGFGMVSGALLAIGIAVIMGVGEWLKKNNYLGGVVEFIYVVGSLFFYTIICGIVEYITLYIILRPHEMYIVGLSGTLPSYVYIVMFITDTLLYTLIIWILSEIFEDDMKSALYVFGWMFIIQAIYYGEIFYSLIISFVKVLIAIVIIKILNTFENRK
ncbi:MAG: hypothetical protein GXN95_06990 [Methanococci archaeon]|nr:hypothetical protein [Methanococci archaeon]